MTHHMQQHSGRKQLAPCPSSSSELCHMQHMHIAQQCLLDTAFDRLSDLSCLLRWEISAQVAQNSMTILALP